MSAAAAAAPAVMEEELEATPQKRRSKEHSELTEVAAASSESPLPPATPDSKPESPAPVGPETLTSIAVAGKERKRKKHEVAAACPLVEEAVPKEEEKKRKRSKHEDAAATPSPSATAAAASQILEVASVGATARKERRRGKVEQGQSGQPTLGGQAAADGGVSGSHSIMRSRTGKPKVLSNREILRMRIIELRKQQPMPQGFVPAMANPNSIDQDPKYSSPFGAFFDQFCYKPDRRQGRNAPSLPKTPDRPARPPPRDHPSSLSSQLTANKTFMAAKTIPSMAAKTMTSTQGFVPAVANPNSIDQDPKYSSPFGAFFDQFCYKPDRRQGLNAPSLPKAPDRPAQPPPRDHPSSLSHQLTANKTFMAAKTTASMAAKTTTSTTKQPHSASASGPQDEVKVKEKKKPEKKMSRMKKPRKRAALLSTAEKWSDKYRRLPLNQLVSPPRSPHKLLQEKYAHDPWKVIVICMLLNLTQGKQVRKKVKGFFKRYPDARTAYTADHEKIAEYLKPLGLQHVKAKNIQEFSKAYVGEEWTYITELCGVGKYAADAYAIFCAGRAKEVVPEDHKLVDYWKYVCFELPLIQESQSAQEAAGVTRQGNFAPEVQQIALSC